MGKFQSSKVFDGFSTVFRQWKAETTHCRFLHGYGISFKVYFMIIFILLYFFVYIYIIFYLK